VTSAPGGEDALAAAESARSPRSSPTSTCRDGRRGPRARALAAGARTPVLILTAYGSIESAVELMRHGAYDYLRKPFQPEDLVFRVEKAVEKFRLEAELRTLRETVARQEGPSQIVAPARACATCSRRSRWWRAPTTPS